MKELVKQTNPWASEAESCTTKGRKVVVNRAFVGVVCTLERLLVRGMMVVGHFHQATKRSPREQPNSHRLTVLLHGNSVNTPLRYVGDVTVVLRRCNMGPTPTKSLGPNLAELTPRQVVCMYQKRWAIALVHWERKSSLGLGEHQVSGMQDRSEQSVGIAVLAYCLWCGLVITRLSLDISGVFFSYSMRCNYGS
jgi:hypothetical protein